MATTAPNARPWLGAGIPRCLLLALGGLIFAGIGTYAYTERIIGIGIGAAVALLMPIVAGWATSVSPVAIALALGFSALIGIFFGTYPARKAAQLDPIEALRYQ